MTGLELAVNVATIFISLLAVVYWVKLFKRMHIAERKDEGWLWIFASVLMVLLLNLSTLALVVLSGRMPLPGDRVFIVEAPTFDFVSTFSRLVMALALSIGTYMLYQSMKEQGDVKFIFSPVNLEAETLSETDPKYLMKRGGSYLIREGSPSGTGRDYFMQKERWNVSGMELFIDQVTHGTVGLLLSRKFPPDVREEYGLIKTPMFWLTKEKDYKESIHPADLTEISHMIKSFIHKGGETVILVEGIEYLITHNSFEEILRLLEGLHDVVAKRNSVLVVTVDPATLSEQQYHLLARSLKEFKFD